MLASSVFEKTLFTLLLLALILLRITYPSDSTAGIHVEGANSVLVQTLSSSENLKVAVTNVKPWILIEYADSVFIQALEKSSEMEFSLSVVSSKILIEYADSVFTITLKRPSFLGKLPTSLTISSIPSILYGETINVLGDISPALVGVTLTLTYIKPDGTTVMRTVVTRSDGSYTDTFKPDRSGRWKVKASWDGDENYYGAESSLVNFEVIPVLFTLTIQAPYEGIPIEVNGRNYFTDQNGVVKVDVPSDSNTVNVKVEPQVLGVDFRGTFISWSDGETSHERILVINKNTTLVVNYMFQYYLEIKTSPIGIVDVNGSGWYDAGSTVMIKPLPIIVEGKYKFKEWIVDGEYVREKLSIIIMDKPHVIVGVYQQFKFIEIALPSGESALITVTTSSEIIELTQISSEKRLTLTIREPLKSSEVKISLPQTLFNSYGSSIEDLILKVNGENSVFTLKTGDDGYILIVNYPPGRFQIDIYYVTYELTLNVKSLLFQQPIRNASIQILQSDETLLKSGNSDSKGVVKFDKLPTTKYIIKAEYHGQTVELRDIFLDHDKNLQLSFFIFDELFIPLALLFIIGGFSSIILTQRRRLIEETKRKLLQLSEKYGKETGGLVLLQKVYLDLEKLNLKNPKYVEKALQQLTKKGLINGVKPITPHLKVVEFTTPMFTGDHRTVLSLVAEAGGEITREDIIREKGWNIEYTENILKEFERYGIARRRITDGKQIWVFEGLMNITTTKQQEMAPSIKEGEKTYIEEKLEKEKIEERVSNESKIIKYYIFLVDFLRHFVSEELKKYYGDNWWEEGVPSDDPKDPHNIRRKCFDQREKYIKQRKATPSDPLINYADLKDLSFIIFYKDEDKNKNNWNAIFRKYYYNKTPGYLIGVFNELHDMRTDIAHHLRKISEEDVKKFESLAFEVICIEEYRRKFRELISSLTPGLK